MLAGKDWKDFQSCLAVIFKSPIATSIILSTSRGCGRYTISRITLNFQQQQKSTTIWHLKYSSQKIRQIATLTESFGFCCDLAMITPNYLEFPEYDDKSVRVPVTSLQVGKNFALVSKLVQVEPPYKGKITTCAPTQAKMIITTAWHAWMTLELNSSKIFREIATFF
jgi:hypothetical protein